MLFKFASSMASIEVRVKVEVEVEVKMTRTWTIGQKSKNYGTLELVKLAIYVLTLNTQYFIYNKS